MFAISYTDGLEEAWANVAEFVPKLVAAVAILVIGALIAKAIRGGAHTVLTKLGVDELVDRSGLGGHIERAGYPDSGRLLATLLYYGVMLIVLKLAIGAFGNSDIQDVLDSMLAYVPKIFVACVILLLTGVIANAVKELVGAALGEADYRDLVATFAVIGVWTIGVFAALDQVQVAEDIVDTLFQAIVASLSFVIVIKFGVGGIWAARDRFWPAVYDRVAPQNDD